jgi:prophage regulatory protein
MKEVVVRIGIRKEVIRRMTKEGKFPRPFRIGIRSVAWKESELTEWMNTRERTGGEQ